MNSPENLQPKVLELRVITRREFLSILGFSGMAVGSGLTFLVCARDAVSSFKALFEDPSLEDTTGFNNQLQSANPSKSEQESANQTIQEIKKQIDDLAQAQDSQGIQKVLDDEQFKNAASTKIKQDILESLRKKEPNLIWEKNFKWLRDSFGLLGNTVFAGAAMIFFLAGTVSMSEKVNHIRESYRNKNAFKRLPYLLNSKWQESKPSQEDLGNFYQKVTILPPMGGKIILKNHKTLRISPTLTAEQQADWILKNQHRFGDGYIHQMTVQGRLRDEFKYVALALITTSPYKNNWEEPFFESPWGKVAPLVHDGDNVNYNINPFWSEIKGRTDFLQRVGFVYKSSNQGADLSFEEAKSQALARSEKDRLLLETRAYQRLAFAYHCLSPRFLNIITSDLQVTLGERWSNFRMNMLEIFDDYSLSALSSSIWFRRIPRDWNSLYKNRYEGDWDDIKSHLILLEETRWQNPGLIRDVYSLLGEVTNGIDQDIGLNPQV